MGGDGEGVSGVVVEPNEDFDIGVVGEAPVGEVALPGLVGKVGFETDVGGLGSFLWFGGDETGSDEVAADRRDRRGHLVVGVEVPGDCLGAGVKAFGDELLAQVRDQLDHGGWELGG